MTYCPPLCCYGNARCSLCKQKGPISQSRGHFTPHQPQLTQDQTILIHVPSKHLKGWSGAVCQYVRMYVRIFPSRGRQHIWAPRALWKTRLKAVNLLVN